MKRLGRILAIICLVVPMLFGMMFLSPNLAHNATQTTQNGGGGGNLLDSPKTGGNGDFDGEENDDKKEGDDTSWTTPTFKTFNDYFVDFDISKDTITDKDYTGNGSEHNPFVVHSTRGFLYLLNYDVSKISLNNRVLELACDIILNDETFDENGNPIGGDGVVYTFTKRGNCNNAILDGKNFHIKGLYYNDSKGYAGGMFNCDSFSIYEIRNFVVEDFYQYGAGAIFLFGRNIQYIDNCIVKNGNIGVEYDNASAFSYNSKKISNCTNYANIIGTNYICGFSLYPDGVIENCTNYGTIKGGFRVSGFVVETKESLTIRNCVNYGSIIGIEKGTRKGVQIAGFIAVGWSYNAKIGFRIIDCANYGKIYSPSFCGGIVAYSSGPFLIYNTHNFGHSGIDGKDYGVATFIGRVASDGVNPTTKAKIINCTSFSKTGALFIGMVTREGTTTTDNVLEIENCTLIFEKTVQRPGLITNWIGEGFSIKLKDCYIEVGGEQSSCALINHANEGASFVVDNVYVKNKTNRSIINIYLWKIFDLEVNGLIIENDNAHKNSSRYYGEDFSGFYVDWKTGKIGIKSISGKGFYQSALTEEWLSKKGYTKFKL